MRSQRIAARAKRAYKALIDRVELALPIRPETASLRPATIAAWTLACPHGAHF